jgi:hypothetical protein
MGRSVNAQASGTRRGSLTLATGRVRVQSQLTGESLQAMYAALGSDGHDFRCSIKGYVDTEEYIQLQDELFRLLTHHSLTAVKPSPLTLVTKNTLGEDHAWTNKHC